MTDLSGFGRSPFYLADVIADWVKGKVVLDLGAGDGYFGLNLRRHAKKVIGIEQNPALVSLARTFIECREGDMFTADISEADIIYCFPPDPSYAPRLEERLMGKEVILVDTPFSHRPVTEERLFTLTSEWKTMTLSRRYPIFHYVPAPAQSSA